MKNQVIADSLAPTAAAVASAIAAIVAAAVTFLAYQISVRQKRASDVALFREFRREFETKKILNYRERLESAIQKGEVDFGEIEEVANAVLGEIEHLANAVRRGAIDVAIVWASNLSDAIYSYVSSLRGYIKWAQTQDSTYFVDCLWLWEKMGDETDKKSRKTSNFTKEEKHQRLVEKYFELGRGLK